MSFYTWTTIIAVVLAGLSAGHWIGGLLAAPATTRPAAPAGWWSPWPAPQSPAWLVAATGSGAILNA